MVTRKTTRPRSQAASEPGNKRSTSAPASNGLGARLRTARERSGATVRGFARAVGVSPSLVSQIERGHVMPSVGTLYAITNELGLLVDDVFKDDREAASRAASALAASGGAERTTGASPAGPVQHQETRRVIRLASGVRWELLTTAPDDELEFLYVVYDVGGESCPEDSMVRHGGKEYAYLISGRLGVKIGFKEFELGPGDSISFDAQMPHRLFAIGEQPAVAVWAVLNREGDRRAQRPAIAVKRGTRGKS
ncbi:MAG TPA: XRE family transcriptional regulator [Ramlibacter sp.]|nr:XRE family transcriptional regulator [Ramlibacter sp.]